MEKAFQCTWWKLHRGQLNVILKYNSTDGKIDLN